MINAVIYYQEPFAYKGYVISGHAGMAEPGYDLVCASVSVLAQTALLGLDAYLQHKKPVWEIKADGYLECWLPDDLPELERHAAQVVIHTMELGLCSIAKEYGQYLKVNKRRWNKCCSK